MIFHLLLFFSTILFHQTEAKGRIKLDFNSSRSALKFIGKWLSGQKHLVNVILPDSSKIYAKDIDKLFNTLSKGFEKKPYFSIGFNATKVAYAGIGIKEVYWFPFQSYVYSYNVYCPEFISPNESQQKYVLFYSGSEINIEN